MKYPEGYYLRDKDRKVVYFITDGRCYGRYVGIANDQYARLQTMEEVISKNEDMNITRIDLKWMKLRGVPLFIEGIEWI